ncbi:LVIVD repeat-containing protein [Zobellia russellii]|uniref:hypothetical protein n=1 Tax=Zobellia russellii TaxID=248907 RepID=UPI001BFF8830|nr:hypothetical protein [Zobellia russellii]MBT9189334.1 hypothetical protein [Zobellia russellii]
MKRLSLAALAAVAFATSCSDETTVFTDTEDNISIEAKESVLENSILYDDAGVLEILKEDGSASGKTSKSGEEMAGDYPLTLIARVDPPSYSGAENLTASHVDVDGDYAYVSYNTVEDGYAGGIDIINVSDPNNPQVSSRLYYSNADINSIAYANGYVYAVGGVDSEKSVRASSNSFVVKIPASSGKLDVSGELIYGFQEGFTANDVKVTSDGVLVTSGKDGLLTSYKISDLSTQNDASFSDLRSVAQNNGTIAVLDASQGVSIMDKSFTVSKTIAISSDFGDNSKRTLDFSGEKIYVSEGSKGAGVYNMTSGDLLEHIPILLNPEGTETQNIVTNAVAINEDVLLMANGGAGLCLSEDKDGQTNIIGVVDLDGSINYVASKGDYIFAASGKAGLQIVKLNRPDQSLESRCAELSYYYGSSNLSVNQGETKEFKGSKYFNSVNVNGSLLLCGTWAVNNSSYINSNGLFEMNGTLYIGRNNKRKNITVNKDAKLRIEGNLTVYGDIILNDGATLEFIGDDSVANVFGSVKKLGSATVIGTFRDVRNKF